MRWVPGHIGPQRVRWRSGRHVSHWWPIRSRTGRVPPGLGRRSASPRRPLRRWPEHRGSLGSPRRWPRWQSGCAPRRLGRFTDLEHQRVGGDECVRSGVERAGRNAPTASSSSLAIDCHCQRSRGWRGGACQAAEPQGSEYRPTGL